MVTQPIVNIDAKHLIAVLHNKVAELTRQNTLQEAVIAHKDEEIISLKNRIEALEDDLQRVNATPEPAAASI